MYIKVTVLCPLVVLVAARSLGAVDTQRAGAPGVEVCYGVRFVVPPGWHIPFPSECGRYWNYPNSRFISGSVLPKGGAEIDILDEMALPLPGDTPAPSLRAWMERELRRAGTKPEATALPLPKETGVTEAIITGPFRWDSRTQRQIGQIIYWRIGGKRLEARVFWVAGDPNAARHQEALLSLVRNMRPQAGGEKRPWKN